jgi:hypothetical protein
MNLIEAAERYYQEKYHTNFSHARKLFILDVFLVLTILLAGGAALFFYSYDTTVVENVQLDISAKVHGQAEDTRRFKSGEHINYAISYKNNSNQTLKNPKLRVNLPQFFQISSTSAKSINNNEVKLSTLEPKASGQIIIEGFYYDKPGARQQISAHLSYRQQIRNAREEKITTLVNILRGSYLNLTVSSTSKIVQGKAAPIQLTVANTGHHQLEHISIPTEGTNYKLNLVDATSTDSWQIDQLSANSSKTISGTIRLKDYSKNEQSIKIIPKIKRKQEQLSQEPVQMTFDILRPKLSLSTRWQSRTPIQPGESKKFDITLENNGDAAFEDLQLFLLIDELISPSRLAQLNTGRLLKDKFLLDSSGYPQLNQLAPESKRTITIDIPLTNNPPANKSNLKFAPQVTSQGKTSQTQTKLEQKTTSQPIKASSDIRLTTEARYYTENGSQLGLGPLPPKVGETTRYWVFVKLKNTTNEIQEVSFSAQLPSYVSWIGRSSVSLGQDLQFNDKNNTVNWNYYKLRPNQTIGLNWSVGLTPTKAQIGKTPVLVKDIKAEAIDAFTEEKITEYSGTINANLKQDSRATSLGTKVQPK